MNKTKQKQTIDNKLMASKGEGVEEKEIKNLLQNERSRRS